MGDLQMIFVVESNSTCKSDWIYIKDTIEQFYQYDRAHHDYDFVWFCKDVEQVYLGKRVDKGKKKKEAEAFRCRRIIESISANRLSVAKHRIGSSNIMKVLDKYLERCTDT